MAKLYIKIDPVHTDSRYRKIKGITMRFPPNHRYMIIRNPITRTQLFLAADFELHQWNPMSLLIWGMLGYDQAIEYVDHLPKGQKIGRI